MAASPSATVLFNRWQARGRLRHLQVLVKVGELRNLKRSAEALGLSQPAVSQLLADLEDLVELKLFERHARGVRITPAGSELLPLARHVLDTLAEGSETLTAMRHAGEGVVRMAAVTSAVTGLLAQVLPAFVRAHPGIQLQVRECDLDAWPLLLSRGEADAAACRAAEAPPAGFDFHPMVEDRFIVACGPRHPLAARRRVSWQRLAQETWLPPPVGSTARRVFDERMTQAGIQPALCHVVTRALTLTSALLQADSLLTLLPLGAARTFVATGQLAVIEPVPALPFTPIGLMLPHEGGSLALRTFAGFCDRFFLGAATASVPADR
jgi:DNA-binding transcriptional LysR family regulator